MSTHEVKVVRLENITKHENADNLGIVEVFGYTVVVNLSTWKEGDLAAYIEPDYVVPLDREEFAFLASGEKTKERIKVKKLRGIYSQGLLVPAPEGTKEGDDVMELLGVERYVPQMLTSTKSVSEPGPSGVPTGKYDLENFKKYKKLLVLGEHVIITEKLHGANARFVFGRESGEDRCGKMFCGSRTRWTKFVEESPNIWWKVLQKETWIQEWCEAHPDHVLYGEVFGWVQNLRYGHEQGELSFRAFDILRKVEGSKTIPAQWAFMDAEEFVSSLTKDQRVPLLYTGPYSQEVVEFLTEGKTMIDMKNKHTREGCVIKPFQERYDMRLGRVALKSVSNKFLEMD